MLDASVTVADGTTLGVMPGERVCVMGDRDFLRIQHFTGTAADPITILDCGVVVSIYVGSTQAMGYVRTCDGTDVTIPPHHLDGPGRRRPTRSPANGSTPATTSVEPIGSEPRARAAGGGTRSIASRTSRTPGRTPRATRTGR